MRALRELLERIRSVFLRAREERELDEELRFHIEMEVEANLRRGLSRREARRQALVAFGGVERFREEVRDGWRLGLVEDVGRELRFALRRLSRERSFSVPAVVTLAVGIGSTAAIFALVNAILLQPLPYPESSRLVAVEHVAPGFGLSGAGQSDGTYLHYRANNRVFEDMGIYYESSQILTDGDQAERIQVAMVTPSTFSLLGAVPFRGRLFTAKDTERESWVVMISHDLWVRRYGADPAIVGGLIEINGGEPREVIGVMPPRFDFPSPETDLWWGMGAEASRAGLGDLWMRGIARLGEGVSPEDAEADLQRLLRSLPEAYPDATAELLEEGRFRPIVTPLKDEIVGDARPALLLLLATAGLVLLIALANVANLFLIRGERQRREIAVSRALGAGGRHLAGRFVTESLVLAAVAAGLGFMLAYAGVELRFGLEVARIPRLHELAVDGVVPAAVLGLSGLSGIVLAVVALVSGTRTRLGGVVAGSPGRMTASRRTRHAQRFLVAWQVALALTLLVGSALMAQSLRRLQRIELGFDPEDVLTFELVLPGIKYLKYHDAAGFQLELLRRLKGVPGVEHAAAAGLFGFPLTTAPAFDTREPITAEDRPPGFNETAPEAIVGFATPGYFEAMRIPLIRGRRFQAGDLTAEAPSVIISETLSRKLFRGGDPVGRRVRFPERAGRPPYTVVGVVGDVTGKVLTASPVDALYLPVLDWADTAANPFPHVPRSMMNVVRTSLPPLSIASTVRGIVREMDPGVPIVGVRTMQEHVTRSMARTRVTMLLLVTAAVAALLLGVVGIYGVLAYTVSQRTRELGVRLALGARPSGVVAMVVRQAARLALAGIVVGLISAFALTRLLGSLLYEVSPTDPLAFGGMAGLLFAVALAAGYLPARRAGRIDPVRALGADG